MVKEAKKITNRFLNACEVYDTGDLKGFIGGMILMIGTGTVLIILCVV